MSIENFIMNRAAPLKYGAHLSIKAPLCVPFFPSNEIFLCNSRTVENELDQT